MDFFLRKDNGDCQLCDSLISKCKDCNYTNKGKIECTSCKDGYSPSEDGFSCINCSLNISSCV